MNGERLIENMAVRIEEERDAGVERVRRRIARTGRAHCLNCGDGIEPARRAALTSAIRCVECERRREVRAMRGW
ncbi:TraR/DksA family transcriptional regulator [Hephaestia caeni]|uniref:TraR/DksA family transcriptional regulator n=1 Tax=Hephaestia caeni TaxID=645617 RepID=A0A397PEH8_9SPHN|nr:TraR/DksA C4-type zinc finger protein [Hephaestia caeni]RIA44061.1 TraR/DksA family transcriptional regulator [Hephaestia caeni]